MGRNVFGNKKMNPTLFSNSVPSELNSHGYGNYGT